MPPRIPDHKRSAILADIQQGDGTLRSIARTHGVSPGTVHNIAKEAGLENPFDRSATKRATEAKVADQRAQRAVTSQRFLDKANDLLDQMDMPHMVFNIGGKDNVYTEHLMDVPPTGDLRNLMVSAGVAFDKHLAADRHDSDDQGLAAVDAWLRTMLG